MSKYTFCRQKEGNPDETERIPVWVKRVKHRQSLAILLNDFRGPDGRPIIEIDFEKPYPILKVWQTVRNPAGHMICVQKSIDFSEAEITRQSQVIRVRGIDFLVTAWRENGKTTLKFNEIVDEGGRDIPEYRVSKTCYVNVCTYPPKVNLKPKQCYIVRNNDTRPFLDALISSGIITETINPRIYWIRLELDSDDKHDGA